MIAVVGGGTMGVGIAHVFAALGEPVVVVEADDARAGAAHRAIAESLKRAGARGHVADADAALQMLTVTADRAALAPAALVIEAVPEDAGLKSEVLAGIETVVGPHTIIATNTSSISVDALADALVHPDRFVGMHFFNPVPASQLVEVVLGMGTAPETVATVRQWADRIGKRTIEVADSPGFASSRLGLAIGLEAIRMVEEGVASPADIDDAMVLGYRFPMGPLRLTDLVGLDVRLGVAEYLARTLGDRFAPPALLREKVARGELGKKSGRGFFDWTEGSDAVTPGGYANLRVEQRDSTVLVGLDRPEKRNALDEATIDSLHRVLDDHAREPCVLVLHSTTPGTFAAGADIAELLERDADAAFRSINAGLCEHLEQHRWPTIAAVDGWAMGGGCELALACDLRVASPAARFGQPELGLGIIAGAGGNWRLAQLVGLGLARRMLYTGTVLDAEAALAAGLVDAVHPAGELLDAALALAATIATRSWRALELTKLALRLHRPATTTFDITAQALLFESDDKRRRMTEFLERRERK